MIRNIKTSACTAGVLVLAVSAWAPVQAGPVGESFGPTTMVADSGVSNLLDPIETTVSTGYDSAYMFRGFNLGEEALWTAIDMSVPISLPVGDWTLSWGAWYVNPTDGPQNSAGATPGASRGALDDELDVYAGLSTTVGAVDVALGYVHYFLGPEQAFGDQNEVGITLGTSVGMFDVGFGYHYNFDAGDPPAAGVAGIGAFDHYFEPSIGTGWDLSDRVGLYVSVSAGWYSTDFSHLQYMAALPIQIAENVVLEPYLAYLDNRNSGQIEVVGPASFDNDDFFGGISLSVSF